MTSEDITHLHASSNSNDLGRKKLCANCDGKDIVNEPGTAVGDIKDDLFIIEDLGHPMEENHHAHTTIKDLEKDPNGQPPGQEMVETVSISQFAEVDTIQCFGNGDSADTNGCIDQNKEVGVHEKQGVKRPQEECDSMESSVRVVYSSLPSRSKRKLEELLSNWSDWHAKHCASAEDLVDSFESGEETYFPSLHVGSDKSSTVSFSMDVPVWKRQRKESVSLNLVSSPLYDRGFAVGLVSDAGSIEERGVDLREAPRCFNCGSYNHPLSGCTKPVNKAAVTSARSEFQSKKNHNGNPRVPTRYYQDSPAGKFDGLKPGALSADTKMLLGLAELDPPPWLNRMRELGYPPGYLDPEEDNQPSGIKIFGKEETQNVDVRNDPPLDLQKSQKKMMMDFPGINVPIPKNADQSLWATPRGPIVSDFSSNQPDNRLNFAHDSMAIENFHGVHGLRNPIDGLPSSFSFGSPPMPQRPYNYYPSEPLYNYYPSEPFSPIGIPIPGSQYHGRPFMHYKYGSF